MMRHTLLAALVLAGCCGLLMAQEPPAKHMPLPIGREVEGDGQDFVFLGTTRPVFMRMHVQIDGVGFRKVWKRHFEKSFDAVDTNSDGKVTLVEMRAASQGGLLSVPTLAFAGVDSRGGHVTRKEWVQWSRQRSGSASDVNFSSVGQQQQNANELAFSAKGYWMTGRGANPAKALMQRLDVDRDKVLTKTELATAGRTLRRLDLDDDEIISADELQPYTGSFNGLLFLDSSLSGSAHQPQRRPALLAIPSTGNTSNLAQQLVSRYDGRGSNVKDGKLSREEMALNAREFDAADADDDAKLDTTELERMLRGAKPEFALLVRLGQDARKLGKFAWLPCEGQRGKPMSLRANSDGTVTVVLDRVHLKFSAADGADVQSRLKSYEAQFKSADRDNNGYLDKKEARRSTFRNQFAQMDGDKNGMLYVDEMTAFMSRRIETSLAHVSARGTDGGKLLFDVMDANRDRRLSQRELAAAPDKLPLWDRNGDGKLVEDEIPRQYTISIGRGAISNAPAAQQLLVFNAATGQAVRRGASTPTPNGPAWFVKMDRNRDGDLSPREFLGSAEEFRRFDVNGDGLIDQREANRGSRGLAR